MVSALVHSLLLAVGTALLAVLLGCGAAVAWAFLPGRAASFGRFLAVLTLVQPPFLAANAWLDLTRDFRIAGNGAEGTAAGLLLTATVLGLTYWPIPALAVAAAWDRLPTEWIEAEPRSRGWGLLRSHLVPAARTALLPAAALVAVLAATQFTLPVLFQVPVLAETIWLRLNTRLDAAGAALASVPLAVIPVALWVALGRPAVSWPAGPRSPEPLRRLLRERIGPAVGGGGIAVAVVAVGLGWGLPWARLLAEPRTWTELPATAATAWGPVLNSFLGAALGAAGAVAVSVWAVARRFPAPRGPGPLWLLFLLPGVVVATAWIALLQLPVLRSVSSSPVWIAVVLGCRFLAPAWAAVRAATTTVDPDSWNAARLGGTWRSAFRTAAWPGLQGRVRAVGYTVFLLALWDVESVVLVVPPGGETLALRIFNLLHYGHATQVNSLCLLLAAVGAAPLLAARFLPTDTRPDPVSPA